MKKAILVSLALVLVTVSGCQVNKDVATVASVTDKEEESSIDSSYDDEVEAIYFDEEDSEICESIIEAITESESIDRDKLDIYIFTNDNYSKRNQWIAKVVTLDKKEMFFKLTEENSDVRKIDKNQYDVLFKEITSGNHDPKIPLYSIVNN